MSRSLQHSGAPIDGGSAPLRAGLGNVFAVLDHIGMLQFSGEDTSAFLQGQLSCDVDEVLPATSAYGAYCSPKGRMLADFLLWRDDAGRFLMALSRDILPVVQTRLSMFVMRSRVKITDASVALTMTGAAGPQAAAAIGSVFPEVPQRSHEVRHRHGSTAIRLPDGRFILVCAESQAQDTQEKMAALLNPVGSSVWRWLDIRNGLPLVTAATQDKLIPQMANLELLGGVSFTKGCYTGQEIVARTQHLGKVKRRMFLANVAAAAAAGDDLYSDDLGDQASGMIANAETSPDGGCDVLAVVHKSSYENSMVRLKTSDGPLLRFLPLPYPVE